MTAPASPPPAQDRDSRSSGPLSPKGQSTAGLWTVALVVAVMVAFLGVSAARDSIQRKQYAEARVAAVYLVRNGNAIGTSMQRLEEVNARDFSLRLAPRHVGCQVVGVVQLQPHQDQQMGAVRDQQNAGAGQEQPAV